MIGEIACAIGKALGACTNPNTIPDLEYTGDMDVYEVSSILIDKFPDAPLYLPDFYYKTCTVVDIIRFLEWDTTRKEKYEADAFDCDDYSWRLKGNITVKPWSSIPFFVVWTNLHALNGFIDSQGFFYFVEPQSNKIRVDLETWQGSQIRFMGG